MSRLPDLRREAGRSIGLLKGFGLLARSDGRERAGTTTRTSRALGRPAPPSKLGRERHGLTTKDPQIDRSRREGVAARAVCALSAVALP